MMERDGKDAPAIEVCDITFHYETWPVLKDLSLRVEAGESVVLMGPNGMGKTSLLGVVAGLLQPVQGFVNVNGRRRRESESSELAIRREMIFLPADPWMPQNNTVSEFVMGVGRAYGVSEERLCDHMPRLLRLFYLEECADDPILSISMGQKRKVALAGALVAERPILVIDEPFSGGLDPSGLAAIREILREFRCRRSTTILMATPVAELADEIVDRVVIMRKGRIVEAGSPEELKAKAGDAPTLSRAVERLMSPDTEARIGEYLEAEKR